MFDYDYDDHLADRLVEYQMFKNMDPDYSRCRNCNRHRDYDDPNLSPEERQFRAKCRLIGELIGMVIVICIFIFTQM